MKKHLQKKCAFHPHQNLVNFCRSPQCLLPMCPTCIKIHSLEHSKSNSYGNYDCISDLHQQIQTNLENTLKSLILSGNHLKQLYKSKQQQKSTLIFQLRQMRIKIMQIINKYINDLQHEILNKFEYFQNITNSQLTQIDGNIHKLSEQTSKELFYLNNQKQMKAIINHISANMPQYYLFKLNQISQRIKQMKIGINNYGKQFSGVQINQSLKFIGECYQITFVEPIKRKSQKNIKLYDTNSLKSSKDSLTECSQKKIL